MGVLYDIQRLTLRIIGLYEKRLKAIMSLIKESVMVIADFSNEQEEILGSIKDNLARVGCLRRRDFDSHMQGILSCRKKAKKKAKEAVQEFYDEEYRILDEIMNLLNNMLINICPDIQIDEANNGDSHLPAHLTGFQIVRTEILPRHWEMEKRLARTLMEFQREQTALNAALKQLLSKGEKIRIKDFKAMVSAMNIHYIGKENGIDKMLKELEGAREEVNTTWQGLFAVYEKNSRRACPELDSGLQPTQVNAT